MKMIKCWVLIIIMILNINITASCNEDSFSLYEEGLKLYNARKIEEANKVFYQFLEIAPQTTYDYYNRAHILSYYFKKYDEALLEIDKGLSLKPDTYYLHVARAELLTALKEYSEAITSYSNALVLKQDKSIYYQRGDLYLENEQYDKAVEDYIKAIEISKEIYTNRTRIDQLMEKAQYKQVVKLTSRLLELNPNDDDLLRIEIRALEFLNEFDQALVELNKIISSNLTNSNAYVTKAGLLKDLQRYREAIDIYNIIESTNLKDQKNGYNPLYINRGLCYLALKRYEQALSDFSKADELFPKYAMVYVYMGNTYFEMGNFDKAYENYDKALIYRDPGFPIYDDYKAEALLKQNRIAEAGQCISYVGLTPSYSFFDSHIITMHLFNKEKKYDKALKIGQGMLDLYEVLKNPMFTFTSELNYELGNTYFERGNYEKAIEYYDKTLEINKYYDVAYEKKIKALLKLGRLEEANKTYQYARKLNIYFDAPSEIIKCKIELSVNDNSFYVNGVKKQFEVAPIIIDDKVYIPIRPIIEASGGRVDWEERDQSLLITTPTSSVMLWLDSSKITVNNIEKTIDELPKVINGKLMLPLRYILETLGYEVQWDGSKNQITISN